MSKFDDTAEGRLRRLVTTGRDPRIDPVEGDVVTQPTTRPGCGWSTRARRVLPHGFHETEVIYQATPRPLGIDTRWCSLRAWRRWAKGGQVVCRGEG